MSLWRCLHCPCPCVAFAFPQCLSSLPSPRGCCHAGLCPFLGSLSAACMLDWADTDYPGLFLCKASIPRGRPCSVDPHPPVNRVLEHLGGSQPCSTRSMMPFRAQAWLRPYHPGAPVFTAVSVAVGSGSSVAYFPTCQTGMGVSLTVGGNKAAECGFRSSASEWPPA